MDAIRERLKAARVIAILRRMPAEAILSIAESLVAGGVQAIEITFGSEGTAAAISAVKHRLGARALVGAGTVMSTLQVDTAMEAGAEFLLSPHFDSRLVKYAQDKGIVFIPGVTTPSEIARAVATGCSLLKLFPAGSLGPGYLKDLKGPFREVDFIPTGGIGKENGASFFQAGALALGMGGLLVAQAYVDRGDFQGLQTHAAQVLEAVSI
ncbi:MAG: bifunctional 4-hydroxy-2-oxoglutarate aldolase/2-dehydro-3-deoxy-phosphogluconate aldolase [Firmicutes bacterium]|nr:bifunctional 4-hydroxy-2-oxoglutarate aldolase/2-dehydro-3-deoxy-phosphogluconate aldolase [Bacillota bacterium]